jgi:hypothetical protein
MSSRNQKLFLLVAASLVIIGFFYSINSNTMFGKFFEQFAPVDWNEVKERDIVKNSVLITLLERNNDVCKAKAEKLDLILSYPEFIKANELASKLKFDHEQKTIIISCKELTDETSRLNIWFVIKEAEKHSTKYEYFITSLNSTDTKSHSIEE